jgi:hypothetical protein
VSLTYPIGYPCAKTLVVRIAYDEECATNVGGASSIKRMKRNAVLIYAEEHRPRPWEALTWGQMGTQLNDIEITSIYIS